MIRVEMTNLVDPTDNQLKVYAEFKTLKECKTHMLSLLEAVGRNNGKYYQDLKYLKSKDINEYFKPNKSEIINFYVCTLNFEYKFTLVMKPTEKSARKLIESIGLQELHRYACSMDTYVGLYNQEVPRIFIDKYLFHQYTVVVGLMLSKLRKYFRLELNDQESYTTYLLRSL